MVPFRLKLESSQTSVTKDTAASTSRITLKGVMNARRSRAPGPSSVRYPIRFSPYFSRIRGICSRLSPPGVTWSSR